MSKKQLIQEKIKKDFDLKYEVGRVAKLAQSELSLPADIYNEFDSRVDRLSKLKSK